MKQFKKEYQNVQINIKAHGIGTIKIDTSTADPNQWASVKELDFMIEDTITPKVLTKASAVNYEEMTLNELRAMFPDIKATSKKAFIEQIA
jgi:hypothetical protein